MRVVVEGLLTLAREDTGIGIPEKNQEHLFGRFHCAEKVRSREAGAGGLGPSIARWNVEACGRDDRLHEPRSGGEPQADVKGNRDRFELLRSRLRGGYDSDDEDASDRPPVYLAPGTRTTR